MNGNVKYLYELSDVTEAVAEICEYGITGLNLSRCLDRLKEVISKFEENLPTIEADFCEIESKEMDKKERTEEEIIYTLYGDEIDSLDIHDSRKARRSRRIKQNVKHHKTDRYHGKDYVGRDEGRKKIYRDKYEKFPVEDRVYYKTQTKREIIADLKKEIAFLEEESTMTRFAYFDSLEQAFRHDRLVKYHKEKALETDYERYPYLAMHHFSEMVRAEKEAKEEHAFAEEMYTTYKTKEKELFSLYTVR